MSMQLVLDGRYRGNLPPDDAWAYGGGCTLDVADGEFALTLSRSTMYSVQETEVYTGTVSVRDDAIELAARERHVWQFGEETTRERTEPSTERFPVRAAGTNLELARPQRVVLGRFHGAGKHAPELIGDLASRCRPTRQVAQRELEALGKEAIGALVERVESDQAFVVEEPGIGARAFSGPRRVTRTVGQECRRLLLRIVTPSYVSPHEPPAAHKPGQEMIEVRDWRAWWAVNAHRPLAEIHQDIARAIDEFWTSGERTRILD